MGFQASSEAISPIVSPDNLNTAVKAAAIKAADVKQILQENRSFFASGKTLALDFRRGQLEQLQTNILGSIGDIYAALKADLGKCETETYVSELALVIHEIKFALKHLSAWCRPRSQHIPIPFQPARGRVGPEPLGVVLIISPWNYPFQLALGPLVSAIAAGNCAIIKPSEMAPQTSKLLAKLIANTFPRGYVNLLEGGVETAQALLAEPFDHIFFTGSPAIGKVVMRAAAAHLTPVTLELGGKNPCIVTEKADVAVAARRIVWGKCFNAGQTCVAPDYLLVQAKVKDQLLAAIARTSTEFFGEDMASSPDYGRIVSDRHFQRLQRLIAEAAASGKQAVDGQAVGGQVLGGQCDAASRYMALTLIEQVPESAAIMQEEIFGPILPVLTYEDLADAIAFIKQRPKPLAIYLFSTDAAQQRAVETQTSSGGLCFNETISHYAMTGLPFGGVGNSGMGKAHGKAGFDTFSHYKSIVQKANWLDLALRYPPYKRKLPWLKKLL
ncbi:MAG: aldehyde dehydrogenase [Phormidesmis sp. RL_2_1]|nr:aldehyde dehydrogenase [Phormidesmis sp. RL_2_1]